jgi:hypothetical protein
MPRRRQPPRKIRARFIEAVEDICPEAFKDLRERSKMIGIRPSWGFSRWANRWATKWNLRCTRYPQWTTQYAEEQARRLIRHPDSDCPDPALTAVLGPDSPTKYDEHFDWLARYQVKGESFRRIGASAKPARQWQSVQGAVHELASLLDLRLRKRSRGGRPARQRN